MTTTQLLSAGMVLVALAACNHDDVPSATPAHPQASPSPPPATETAPHMGSTMTQPMSSETTEPEPLHSHPSPAGPAVGPVTSMTPESAPIDLSGLDDGQLAAIVQAIHQAEIERVDLALSRASSADVLRLARADSQVHRDGARQDKATLARLKLSPSTSAMSKQVRDDWQQDSSALEAARATEFDRTFVDHQVALDEKAITLIDSAIAAVKSLPLKQQLIADRVYIGDRLRETQDLQKTLRARTP
jgi:predicted outer membrane protein